MCKPKLLNQTIETIPRSRRSALSQGEQSNNTKRNSNIIMNTKTTSTEHNPQKPSQKMGENIVLLKVFTPEKREFIETRYLNAHNKTIKNVIKRDKYDDYMKT